MLNIIKRLVLPGAIKSRLRKATYEIMRTPSSVKEMVARIQPSPVRKQSVLTRDLNN